MNTLTIQRAQLFGICALLIGFAIWSPTGKFDEFPKYWWDEAFTIEIAQTFNELGVFDLTVAPHKPSNIAIAVNANGFPLSYSLALLFRLTGTSVTAARILMVGWMLLLFFISYFFFKKYLGHEKTLSGLLLIATFASFYANGRTATGDVPGLVFFTLALYALTRKHFFITGILTALALVTKTSSFHVAPIAIGLAIIFSEETGKTHSFVRYIFGGLLVAFFWLWLLLPTLSMDALTPAIDFFKNPTHKPSLISLAFTHPRLLITQSFLLVIGLGAYIIASLRSTSPLPRTLNVALVTYGILQTLVYLRSPGWSRYLLSIEFFLLLILPYAISSFLHRISPLRSQKLSAALLPMTLAVIFSIHYQFASDIFPRKSRDGTVTLIRNELNNNPQSTIGFIDDPVTASLISGNRKYQYIRVGGNTYAGENFSINKNLPDYLSGASPSTTDLLLYYDPLISSPDLLLWKLKSSPRAQNN